MAVGDEYLASVRHSVRLSSTVHDGELTDLINAARADLVLGGVLEAKANDETDPLIKKAVTTYVKAEFGLDNEDADRLRASYKEQRNGLSLSDSYIAAEGGIAHVLARRCDAQSRYGGARRGRFSERDNHGDDRFRRRVLYQAERVLRRPTSGYLARADGKAPRR